MNARSTDARPILFGGVVMNNSPYIGDPPTIPEGDTLATYRLARGRKRSWLRRLWRRLHGH